MAQRDPLAGVEALHALGQGRGDGVGQRQVHVVAAEQDVLADGQARQGQVAPFVGDGDQGEVGRPAADVADQDDVADLDLLAPSVALGGQPGVERGLRLLEQRDVLRAPPCAAASMVSSRATASNEAGTVRKTSWFSSRSAAVLPAIRCVPGVAQVLEVGRRGGDRRDPGHVLGRRPGQDGGAAVDAGVREPALGRAHQPARHLGPVVAGEDADHAVRRRLPGQVERPRGKLLGRRQSTGTTGAAAAPPTSLTADDLRDRQPGDRRRARRPTCAGVGVRQRAVGRSQVDADHVARHAVS